MRTAVLASLAVLAALPVAAQDRPPLLPTRDVSVLYRITSAPGGAAAAGQEMRWSWLTAEQKLRMDLPGGLGWTVMDQRARRGSM